MARKPTGKPNGRPRNAQNNQLLAALNQPKDAIEEWDGFFDAYNFLQENGAPVWMLVGMELLIQEHAPNEVFRVKIIVQEATTKLTKAFGAVPSLQLVGKLGVKSASDKKIMPALARVGRSQRTIVDQALIELNFIRSLEAQHMAPYFETLLEKISSQGYVKQRDFVKLGDRISTKRPAEAQFILDYIRKISEATLASGRFETRRRKMSIPSYIRDSSLHQIAMNTYDKILRNGQYDLSQTDGRKKGLIREIFSQQIIDYEKKIGMKFEKKKGPHKEVTAWAKRQKQRPPSYTIEDQLANIDLSSVFNGRKKKAA